MRYALCIVLLVLLCVPAFAQGSGADSVETELFPTKTIYGHIGDDSGGAGILFHHKPTWALGFDFGIEGEREDQTGWNESTEDGWSFNLLLGLKTLKSEKWEVIPFGLVGVRTYKTTCPTGPSYIGFRCYADFEPEQHWKGNYGGGVVLRIGRFSVGIRATGESTTGIIGWSW